MLVEHEDVQEQHEHRDHRAGRRDVRDVPADILYVCDESGEPAPAQYMVEVDRADTTGTREAGSDATDAPFFSASEVETSDPRLKRTPVDRLGGDSLQWLLDYAKRALVSETTHESAE